jgi:uncharacterized membrane protein
MRRRSQAELVTRRKALAAIFAISGVLHFITPRVYESIVPSWLPRRRAMVYVSGAMELVCAGGLAAEKAWAGPASAALLLAVWPANVQMAVDASRGSQPLWRQALMWGRVPLQIPMIRIALARNGGGGVA